ncbi:hypothetical protein [Paenibacillus sp. 1001270B_150601_E10]|uniref:hypothetical protein n=1 Tax=Paenibacillus sp. 1001270B_150601_E10 TaxID=2787079 RepID=UPI0018A1229C|nr:hypothetical protein [Paenibacillus sp. 1001270B_150601_E10]
MLLRKNITIISLVLTLILAAACYYFFAIYNSVRTVHVSSDYVGYSTGKELFNHAELVVIGSPIKDLEDRELHIEELPKGFVADIATFTEMNVEKVLKGSEEDAINLTVIEPIGVYQTFKGKKRIAYEGYTEMKKGSKYLIFMKKNSYGQYSVINMQSGKFNLDGADSEDISGEKSFNKQKMFTELKAILSQEIQK